MDAIFQALDTNPGAVVAAIASVFAAIVYYCVARRSINRDKGAFADDSRVASILCNEDSVLKKDEVKGSVEEYDRLFSGARDDVGAITSDESIQTREREYKTMVNNFYDLVTDFYEWGWGQSFHFAPRFKDETFFESIKRAEHHLANRLNILPGHKVLDAGCGVGGPMRNIAEFSGGHVTGITINQYQVNVGNKYNAERGLGETCKLVQGDFQKLPFEDNSFDAAYEIEATCHSPDKQAVFSEIHRCLKPGAMFAGYEWIVTDNYDADNQRHVQIKEGIEVGNGLPTLATAEQVVEAMEAAGFEMVDYYDANRGVHSPHEIPWYDTLNGKMTLSGFRMTHFGRICTHAMVSTLEFLRIAPKGSKRVSEILNATAIDLVDGGKKEIFTPSFFFIGRKV